MYYKILNTLDISEFVENSLKEVYTFVVEIVGKQLVDTIVWKFSTEDRLVSCPHGVQ
jgi:hypothetical protein